MIRDLTQQMWNPFPRAWLLFFHLSNMRLNIHNNYEEEGMYVYIHRLIWASLICLKKKCIVTKEITWRVIFLSMIYDVLCAQNRP